jgi:hypothetical protein
VTKRKRVKQKESVFLSKNPTALHPPEGRKEARSIPFGDPQRQYPAWRLFKLEMYDRSEGEGTESFGWHEIGRARLSEIRKCLQNFETMTWSEIRNGSHMVSVDDLIRPARKRLEELKLDDLDYLFSLRLAGKERVWGILEGNIFNILWWDPLHKICPAPKKHT